MMGSNDVPPPHVSTNLIPIANALLQAGGGLWTVTYILLTRQSFKDRTYGMPLFALALNFAWEIVYALYVAESPLERSAPHRLWDGLRSAYFWEGRMEPCSIHEKHLGTIFWLTTVWAILGHWTFAKWWIDNDIGQKEGKFYRGRVGPDTTELGFWSALLCQVVLSVASLVSLLVRRHTGGVSWGIWGSRMMGSVLGLYGNYGWLWWGWREAHKYFANPFAVFMLVTCLLSDFVYPFFFMGFRRTEKVLADGRKVAADFVDVGEKKVR
ncbi:uncharacterized protein PAC_05412 [Phialocephala subalpina]|uniref:Uncharacterized protein n=1 Tax=Phialocephala subalpina TaxID=576137 RepID=A0A1L7WRV9_9HELO|nr:uncharacterized protein PAC_05412 [Phialocephala subalpina]